MGKARVGRTGCPTSHDLERVTYGECPQQQRLVKSNSNENMSELRWRGWQAQFWVGVDQERRCCAAQSLLLEECPCQLLAFFRGCFAFQVTDFLSSGAIRLGVSLPCTVSASAVPLDLKTWQWAYSASRHSDGAHPPRTSKTQFGIASEATALTTRHS